MGISSQATRTADFKVSKVVGGCGKRHMIVYSSCQMGSIRFKSGEEEGCGNTFHSSTDSSQNPGIPEDSGRNTQESDWNRQKISVFRLYILFYFIYISWNRGIDKNGVIFKNLTKPSCSTKSLFFICMLC